MQYFTTFFDKNYLSRGLVLLESLQKNSSAFKMYLLCLDTIVFDYFENNKLKYPQVKTIALTDFENQNQELYDCKANRTLIEYYFTLSPCLPLFILEKFNLPHICSLDADIKFYSSPQKLFDYLETYSLIITPHKFSKETAFKVKYGKYNVSFQIFKNDETGLECLTLWKKQCIEWCKDELDEINNRFADQRYLDNWEIIYPEKVKSLDDNISGLAVWNLNNFQITKRNNSFLSNNEPIIFYHFHHNKFYNNRWATNGFYEYSVVCYNEAKKLYLDYWTDINKHHNISLQKSNSNSDVRELMPNILRNKLKNEKTLFLKFHRQIVFYLDFNKTNKFLNKLILKLYS